jgi:hypothetical protein
MAKRRQQRWRALVASKLEERQCAAPDSPSFLLGFADGIAAASPARGSHRTLGIELMIFESSVKRAGHVAKDDARG